MGTYAKLGLVLCVIALVSAVGAPSVCAQTIDEQILARLNALEKENAALRARVSNLEASLGETKAAGPAAKLGTPAPAPSSPSAGDATPLDLAQDSPAPARMPSAPDKPVAATAAPAPPRPQFEISGSLLFLQPSTDDFQQYAEVANPFPVATPSWSNASIDPKYSAAFDLGVRYMPSAADDIGLDWTHFRATDRSSVGANPSQFVGPPYSIGPTAGAVFLGGSAMGSLQSQIDIADVTAGHTFCVGCSFEFRLFGGVEYAHLGENLTGTFQNPGMSIYHQYVSDSLFNGAGPRLGMRGQYNFGPFQFFGEAAAAGLIGAAHEGIDFATQSPALADIGIATNNQSLTSPTATQVIPSFDAKLGTAYTFPATRYGLFKLGIGYRVAVFFNAVNHFALTNVATVPLSTGVFLSTEQQLKSDLTIQGPYVEGSWLF